MRNLWWAAGLVLAALIVIVLAPLASSDPDGLERVASDGGWLREAQAAPYQILPGYSVPGVDAASLSTMLAGLIGVVIVVALTWALGALLASRRRTVERETS